MPSPPLPVLQQATLVSSVEQFAGWLLAAADQQQPAGHAPWSAQDMHRQLQDLHTRFLAGELFILHSPRGERGGCLLGALPRPAWRGIRGDALYVDHMLLAPAERGAGSDLLAGVEEHALRHGFHELRLDSAADSAAQVQFFQAHGFYPQGEVTVAGRTRLRLSKRLDYARELERRLQDWQPDLVGTLGFAVRGSQVLLIRKLRGHGAGKINGPGGKLDPGETPRACVLRETVEEVGLQLEDTRPLARLRFVAIDDDQWLGYVFGARAAAGQPSPSAEAEPFWCPLEQLPLDEMWADDRVWLPDVLAGRRLAGDFLFADGTLVAHRLRPLPAEALALFDQSQ